MKDLANVGLYLDWSDPDPDEDGVFGRDVAVEGFCEALLRYSSPGKIRLFRNSPVLSVGSDGSDRLQSMALSGVDPVFSEIRKLKADFESHPFSVWHDMDGNLQSAHDLRARYSSRLYPITATPHVFSYATLGHSWVLRMLLQPGYSCDAMICPTRAAKSAFTNLVDGVRDSLAQSHDLKLEFEPRTDIIPLGLDTELFRPRPKHPIRKKLNLPKEVLILLWVGRLSPLDKADLLPLIRVFFQLCRDNPDEQLILLIGGSGHRFVERTLVDYVNKLGLSDKVIFSTVPSEERHLYHAAADIFLSPADSIQETFGITPIEAMSCGVPQVVSDWNGYKDTVVDGKTGFRIDTMMTSCDEDVSQSAGVYDGGDMFDHFLMGQSTVIDPVMMQKRLQELISNKDLRYQMSQESRQRALQCYDWSVVIKSYEELWSELGDIAKKLSWKSSAKEDYEGLKLSQIFGHYATQKKDLFIMTFVLSDFGERVCDHKEILPAYQSVVGVLSVPIICALMDILREKKFTYELIVKHMQGNSEIKITRNQISKHLLWLLKMGLILSVEPEF